MMSSYLQNWPLSGTDTESDEDSLLETYNGGARFQQTKEGGGVAYVRWPHQLFGRSRDGLLGESRRKPLRPPGWRQ